MAKKFINLEAAVSQILDNIWTKTDEDGYIWVLRRDVVHALDNIPTADVMEVVRCKDCVYYNQGAGFCDHFNIDMYDSDYCSDGYRRISNA